MPDTQQCPVGVKNSTKIEQLREDHNHLVEVTKENKDDIWVAIDEIKKALASRPPLWCTFLLMAFSSALTGFIVRAFT